MFGSPRFHSLCWALLASSLFSGWIARLPAQETRPPVDFAQTIWPALQEACVDCHGPDLEEGQLRLDAATRFFEGGVNGPLIDREQPRRSLLLSRLHGQDGRDRMPLDAEPLADDVLDSIEAWITAGAPWPAGLGPEVPPRTRHWAYVAPRRLAPPHSANDPWSGHPLDRWVLESMTEHQLTPAAQAPRGKLLRRLYLDLIGLPPTAAELSEFLADQRPDALERQIDRLLASPHYGQRWARQWLDAARYADSNGYQADQYREVWPYRDWVVDSFNVDKPFDQFTTEQLAGDLLPDARVEDRVATGFHRLTTCNVEAGVDPEENRVNQVLDRVNTTATVWLGTTLECCQCHSHKYDPFNQREYYQLFAYFNNTPLEVRDSGNNIQFEFIGPKMELPLPAESLAQRQHLETRAEQFEAAVTQRRQTLLAAYAASPSPTATADQSSGDTSDEAAAGSPQSRQAPTASDSNQDAIPQDVAPLLKQEFAKLKAGQQKKVDDFLAAQHADFQALRNALTATQQELKQLEPDTTLVMIENPTPRQTRVFKRGDFLNPGEQVEPGTPAALHPQTADRPNDRLGLAQWIMDPANPLTARVTVNRWWGELLGRPLVETTEDFGTQGERPSHPAVLDWLALELIRSGWSMKSTHRQILLSATYRQDSAITQRHLELDPHNRWLSRGGRQRLPAETIRDNALRIAGVLTEQQGGPPVFPPQPPKVWRHVGRNAPVYQTSEGSDRYRRGLYVFWRRSAPYPSFVNFDAPDRASCTVKRPRTNTPLQALTLLNDPAYLELAAHLADSVLNEHADAVISQPLTAAFRRCVARDPSSDELAILTQLFDDQLTYYQTHPGQAQAMVKSLPQRERGAEAFAAWLYVASTLLNLDETICRD